MSVMGQMIGQREGGTSGHASEGGGISGELYPLQTRGFSGERREREGQREFRFGYCFVQFVFQRNRYVILVMLFYLLLWGLPTDIYSV